MNRCLYCFNVLEEGQMSSWDNTLHVLPLGRNTISPISVQFGTEKSLNNGGMWVHFDLAEYTWPDLLLLAAFL